MVSLTTAQALAGLRGDIPTRFTWQRRTAGYVFRDTLSPAVAASSAPTLDLDNDRAVLRAVRGIELRESALDDLDDGTFDPTADIVAIIEERLINGSWQQFPLGAYKFQLGDTRYGRDGEPVIECDAADLSTVLTESGPSSPYTVSNGTNYATAVEAVLDNLGLTHALDAVAATLPTDQTWPPYPETTWWQVVKDLADGINYRTPWPNSRGQFVWRAWEVDPSTATEDVTYTDADEPRMVEGDAPYRRRQRAETLANRAVVLIDDPFHPDFGYVIRENADADSPISTVHRPERQMELRWDSSPVSTRAVLDLATAEDIAETLLRLQAARYRTATLSTLPDPRRGAHEYYRLRITHPDGSLIEDGTLWRVARWSRPLTAGGRHEHEVEHVETVDLIDPEAS